ncbi:Hsp70 family protein [Dactylosporangium sp. CA-092794]|uniref:Hsp70 family protein n=1 Tax=Dactylosporangium sp. CA-092794 TaxID=3239929 RepID=UPI003D9474B7
MTAARQRLGIDFGTSTTIAMLQRLDARVQPLLFDGSPLLSSAVLLGPDGQLHTGRDAAHLARSAPERLEPNPKRRIDEVAVLLGDREVAVRDLIVSVLARVAREAGRVAGPVRDAALTHPANWGQNRRALLADAARQAGFVNVELVGEPTAAATYLAHTRAGALPPGSCVLVYDLGAGTCDVTLLRRTPTGFEQVASDGLNDVGGLDVDAAVIAFLQATYGELWTSAATRRQLWDDVRSAKEMLSRASGTVVMVPALGKEVPLGREQLEGLARPVLRPTVSMTRALVQESGVGTAAIAGLFLVGGSSRIPLVATMLHETLGIAPAVAEQPELVVAEGALYVNRMVSAAPPTAAPISATPGPAQPVSTAPYPSTQTFAAPPVPSPVSTQPFGPAPVSPPSPGYTGPAGYAGPSAYPQPPVPAGRPYPPPHPPAVPATRRRGLSPALIAVLVVAALLLVTGAVVGANHFLSAGSGTNPTANGGTGPGAAGGQGTAGTADPGKYDLAKIPADECAAADISPFKDVYEAELGAPTSARNPNATVNQSTCTLTREHAGADPSNIQLGTLLFIALAYSNVALAVTFQNSDLATAKLAGPLSTVAGLGEEAIVFETTQTDDKAKTELHLTLVVRDSNVRLTVYYIGSRQDGAGWSQKDKDSLRDKLVASGKAAFAKTIAGMAR